MALNESVIEPTEAAESAGLVHVHDRQPGITRKKAGAGFAYFGSDGERIQDDKTLQRIRKLAIPPAWRDVWITASRRGHLQATGRERRAASSTATILVCGRRWRTQNTNYARFRGGSAANPQNREHRVEEELRDELSGLRPEEAAVLVFLQRRLQCTLKDKLSESLEVRQRQASAPQRKNKPKRLAAAAA